ncbi:conserved protein of unknown function [Kyrpidia spormannii]|uniref:Uncharacterized protein n=3 Tax=Kyrpidia TaxID=1129704 RepID=A0ACA8Z8C4_9BACL|nr:hypothetical protein Btus_1905 [Kyrpidia tusciae DSM 2912]CAB3391702.1 conserved protein of unknown function [Kyrpidia spormannii]CAB3392615.1 conserved protein of unknown function [Kyrpidia spormannii]
MLGVVAAAAAIVALLFMCASLTKENTEEAVRKQYLSWKR